MHLTLLALFVNHSSVTQPTHLAFFELAPCTIHSLGNEVVLRDAQSSKGSRRCRSDSDLTFLDYPRGINAAYLGENNSFTLLFHERISHRTLTDTTVSAFHLCGPTGCCQESPVVRLEPPGWTVQQNITLIQLKRTLYGWPLIQYSADAPD